MKKILLVFMLGILTHESEAQLDSLTFDFWIGKWDASWQNSKGESEHGTNLIERILDGSVLQEHFEIVSGANKGFKGTSISVWNSRSKTYHQAWADNQGGYFDFTGEVDGDRKIFKTAPRTRDNQVIIQRMVFYDIKENSFTWDWESSMDSGNTWSLMWRINYTRSN